MSALILSRVFEDRSSRFDFPLYTPVVEEQLAALRTEISASHGETLVGIEYEIENCVHEADTTSTKFRIFQNYWNTTEDGSLRNDGLEFVSKPLKGVHVANALLSLRDMLNMCYPQHKATGRCGIHVHIHALDLTVPQVYAWISTYMIFERQLFKYSGSRSTNLFCLPTWSWADNIKSGLKTLDESVDNQSYSIRNLATRGLKYTGMNTLPLMAHGTLEFRQMATTLDFNKISLWVDLLSRVKEYSRNISSVESLRKYWEKLGALNTTSEYRIFMDEVFGPLSQELLIGDYTADMAAGVVGVKEMDIIYSKSKAPRSQTRPSAPTFSVEDFRVNTAIPPPPEALPAFTEEQVRDMQERQAVRVREGLEEMRRQADENRRARATEALGGNQQRATHQSIFQVFDDLNTMGVGGNSPHAVNVTVGHGGGGGVMPINGGGSSIPPFQPRRPDNRPIVPRTPRRVPAGTDPVR